MVLFKPSFSGVSRLELNTLHDESTGYGRKKAEKTVVRLDDCLSATSAPDESCPPGCTAFYLNTTANNFILASTCTQQWLSAIWLQAFQVSLPLFSPAATPSSPTPSFFFLQHDLSYHLGKVHLKLFHNRGRDSTMRKLTPYL